MLHVYYAAGGPGLENRPENGIHLFVAASVKIAHVFISCFSFLRRVLYQITATTETSPRQNYCGSKGRRLCAIKKLFTSSSLYIFASRQASKIMSSTTLRERW